MDEFPGLLARDFGFRPQGKNAPMAASKAASVGGVNLGTGSARSSPASTSWNKSRSGWNSTGDSLLGDHGVEISENRSSPAYDDVFGGPPSQSNSTSHGRSGSATSPPSFDSIFEGFKDSGAKPVTSSSLPVYDKPVYDDDIFDGVPGIKSSSIKYDDVFTSMSAGSNHVSSPPYDDLLENLGKAMPESKGAGDKRPGEQKDQDFSGFEELIPGFGGSSPPHKREIPVTNQQKAKPTASTSEDPFVVLETTSTSAYSSSGLFNDPLEHISRTTNSGSTKTGSSSVRGSIFDDANVFNGFSNSVPSYTSEMNDNQDENPQNNVQGTSPGHHFGKEPPQRSSMEASENITPKMQPSKSDTYGRNAMADQSPKSHDHLERTGDQWLTVNEIPLSTQPTTAPPPLRPPPPLVIKQAPFEANTKRRENEPFSQPSQNYSYPKDSVKKSSVSPIDELEDFAMGKPQTYAYDHEEVFTNEGEIETNSAAAASAAAMKEAMDRAEAKIKHAREVRGRERAQQERDGKAKSDAQDIEDKEKQERLDREREQKERDEKEKEQKRLERERELELERERERARQAVGRATREARERAAAEARAKAERAAYEKAAAEARQRAERAAVQRAAAEARERAAAEARQRAERAAAEAREKAATAKERGAAESREKAAAERAAVERAAAEARMRAERVAVDRANAEARERAAAAARGKQNKTENDLESFFSMGARANSAPKQRATSAATMFDTQAQGRGSSDASWRTSSGSSSTMKKASSTTNIADDLSSIFGAPSSSGEFQDIEGESEERRKARFERHQRTLERAAKALAEKNERDLQTQRDQAERHRIAETLDAEIKRWAAGKEANLRALLSTLQYVLWPECGWQPVSLTDLITAAAVKKVYRKATLCIHPDKVQQKGANLQQKYIAEKVFDLLKEAWNKFNSEELF
ncbi:auxilin-related protein 2-like [Phoenix dactylifera]|uniref:Auxilin-related protein 2-like n=1 Tax=Phoenix dactylifera TaxID=42345 RepID=A0A8B7CVH5_PHODC|nr:auxilin-related protein 2-like [Phoenix dactylifera]